MATPAEQPIAAPNTAPTPMDPNAPTFDNPHFASAIQRARQEEKQKLYSTINGTKKKLQEAEQRQAAMEAEMADLKSRLDRVGQPELKGDAAIQARIDELSRQLTASTQQNQDLNRQIRAGQLEAYKERRLREVGPEIFVQLVGGATESEIDESIARAQASYAEQRDFFAAQWGLRPGMHPAYPYQAPHAALPAAYPYPAPAPTPGFPTAAAPAPAAFYPQPGTLPPGYYPPTQPAQPQPYIAAPVEAPPAPVPAAPVAPAAYAPPAPSPVPAPVADPYYARAMEEARARSTGMPGVAIYPRPGFPTPVAAGSAPAPAIPTQTDLKTMTSEEAIRSGAYAKNRGAILESVRTVQVGRR